MVCPLDILAHLVALQGDPHPTIQKEALRLLQVEDAKHPSFLDNRLLDGVELSFDYQVPSTVYLPTYLIN